MSYQTAHRAGFSLLELVIVLTLLAILSMAVVPVFRGTFVSVAADHGVRDLTATVRYAQERAVTDCTEYRLYLDPEAGEYVVHQLDSIEADRTKVFVPARDRLGQKMRLPENVEMRRPKARKDKETNSYYIAFFPNGACDDAEIVLETPNRRRVRIRTEGSLGRMKVDE